MTTSLLAHLTVDPASDRPPFEQVRLRIVELIADGTLLTGERLPTVRALAAHLDLAPNTVAKTYRELEAAGVIETRGRSGSFVKAGRHDAQDAGFAAASTYVGTARELGLDDDTIVSMVQRALRAP
ncbi:GntR family transcriptional regulator [Gordonia amicalis]|uniref:GntR family transcriptional regulator n=1 Tax=Gordonia amicalis TaxID=89053 RepID=A0ABU4DIF1_9ACTN|nr:GntR family transcriptional regulator [Gordonia amicalis]MDJ0454940.1 GntR family transcriptional regulator [Gordonia amicalis]MDV6309525.1 GntR family transcriptional regulator [Gordonia amicalis]MDV7078217.1 GntR family transcriptional regulator [Gordonia amicalis]MDV7101363.1 GntR family transcriptional regulator [Gordonia amicalis]